MTAATCIDCGGKVSRGHGRTRCRACWRKSNHVATALLVCKGCGKVFEVVKWRVGPNGGRKGDYCSRECAFEHQTKWRNNEWKKKPCTKCGAKSKAECICGRLDPRICEVCGNVFTPVSNRSSVCSEGCRKTRNSQERRDWYRSHVGLQGGVNVCHLCNRVEVYEKYFSRVDKGICVRCKKRSHRARQDANRRAGMRGGDLITLLELWMRDNKRCCLCGRATRVPGKAGGWHKTMATIDHIVPLARGGTHTWSNVQLACAQCNTLKNATTKGQLRLFG